jgi:hypothetical protein
MKLKTKDGIILKKMEKKDLGQTRMGICGERRQRLWLKIKKRKY